MRLVSDVFGCLVPSMESLRCPTFGWDLERTLITSISCKHPLPVLTTTLAEVPNRKQYLLTVSLCGGLPEMILIHIYPE